MLKRYFQFRQLTFDDDIEVGYFIADIPEIIEVLINIGSQICKMVDVGPMIT